MNRPEPVGHEYPCSSFTSRNPEPRAVCMGGVLSEVKKKASSVTATGRVDRDDLGPL